MSNSRECMGVNGEALELRAVYKSRILYYKSCEDLYQEAWILLVNIYTRV